MFLVGLSGSYEDVDSDEREGSAAPRGVDAVGEAWRRLLLKF